ncbi:MAG TPA: FAD-dependent oxidoreductase [Gammaproteobacteria bacterium]|jgi:oxygen-dependent protoporphyrinogen oxidase|nr:FAD-dependent oxidoreductase [Gammaproteobacteria bacterium]
MGKNIAVIGAGIAGLTAAYYLKKFGYTVTVYEASNRVGGRMTTDRVNNCLIDRGAQFLSPYYPTLIPLIQELGMDTDLIEASPDMGIVRGQKVRKISINRFLSPITSGYLGPKEAISFLITLSRWKNQILSLPLDDYSAWAEFDDEYTNHFITREFGESILEYMIEPQMQGFYYQTPEETSKILGLMLLNFLLRKGNLKCLRYGMGSLPGKLASLLNIKLNCPISCLIADPTGGMIIESDNEKFHAERVVLATPATISKSLFSKANDIEKTLLQTQYSSTINIGIFTDKNWKLPKHAQAIYGFLIPRRERKFISAIGIESNKYKNNMKEGELLNVMLESQHAIKLFNKSDDEILKIILPELEQYFPKLSTSICFSHFIRWPEAEPVSALGRSKCIKKYKETLDSKASIILAGDYMGFPYTDSAAFTGKWAANFIREPVNQRGQVP